MAIADIDRLSAEHDVLLDACGLVDRSERGRLALTGADSAEFLNGQVTNEVATLCPGEGCYAAFLTHKGKMLGDLRILAVRGDDDEAASMQLLLDTERVALQALFDMIRRYKVGFRVELHKRTLERGMLSLIGPDSGSVAGAGELPAVEHASRWVEIGSLGALAVRTDVGVDLICDASHTAELTRALLDRSAVEVSSDAAECLRIERGRPRFGLDLDETVIPQEAGLNERAVSFTKGCYVGQETVARLHYRGKPNRHLRGLLLSEPSDTGEELRLGDRVVGRLGSTTVSPRLGAIGLAILRREAEPGALVGVGAHGEGEVVTLPFAER